MNQSLTSSQRGTAPQEYQKFEAPLGLKVMIGWMYFLEGVLTSLPYTMIIIYPHLPPEWIISIFTASRLPYSLKFVIAPAIEKYSSLWYGKRKTWIIISQGLFSMTILAGSFVTQEKNQATLGVLFIFLLFFMSLHDISLSGVAIKELRRPEIVGFLRGTVQTTGICVGSLIVFNLTSNEFAKSIGLNEAITSPAVVLRVLCFLCIATSVLIHFLYKERALESELKVRSQSILKILSYYKVFFQIRTKYCRTLIMLLFYAQGFILFEAFYQYELINRGFSRATLTLIMNISFIPMIVLAVLLASFLRRFGWLHSMMVYMVIRWTVELIILLFFPTSVAAIAIIQFVLQVLDTLRLILISMLVNSFPILGISGMLITMMNCGSNFGKMNFLHILLTAVWGWEVSAILGLSLQAILAAILPRYFRFLEKGTIEIQGMFENKEKSEAETKTLQ